jgi:hypothetical protein
MRGFFTKHSLSVYLSVVSVILLAVSHIQSFHTWRKGTVVRVSITQDIILPKGIHHHLHKLSHGTHYKWSSSDTSRLDSSKRSIWSSSKSIQQNPTYIRKCSPSNAFLTKIIEPCIFYNNEEQISIFPTEQFREFDLLNRSYDLPIFQLNETDLKWFFSILLNSSQL